MSALNINDFSGSVGDTFSLPGGVGVDLRLEAAQPLPSSKVRDGGSFKLEFSGPREPVLPQATYRIRNDDREFDIFIVPISQTADETRYEAIFN